MLKGVRIRPQDRAHLTIRTLWLSIETQTWCPSSATSHYAERASCLRTRHTAPFKYQNRSFSSSKPQSVSVNREAQDVEVRKKVLEPLDHKVPNSKYKYIATSAYDPKSVERGWYEWWEDQAFFRPESSKSSSESNFVIVHSPPSVTGQLHLGKVPGFT
jgi:hypothetical protein